MTIRNGIFFPLSHDHKSIVYYILLGLLLNFEGYLSSCFFSICSEGEVDETS